MDALFKVIIFGDGGVGKTTFVNRYLTGVFKGDTTMTIGVDFHIKKLELDRTSVGLQIWDFSGEEQFRFLLPTYVLGASGGIFMYDITRYSSLKNITEWIKIFNGALREEKFQIPAIMVGGKLDLEENRSINYEHAKVLAEEHNFSDFFECSAKTGENIEKIFIDLSCMMLENAQLL